MADYRLHRLAHGVGRFNLAVTVWKGVKAPTRSEKPGMLGDFKIVYGNGSGGGNSLATRPVEAKREYYGTPRSLVLGTEVEREEEWNSWN